MTDTEATIRRKKLGSVYPKEEDLHGSAQSLIRLQEVYDLDIIKFITGHLTNAGGVEKFYTKATLSAQVKTSSKRMQTISSENNLF